jgi:hypothetical protein
MAGWRVWGELRRRSHLELVWARLSGHRGRIEQLAGGRRRIILDTRLDPPTRRAVLAHELVHDERGILYTDDTPAGIVRKEEAIVNVEVARRLVPAVELDAFIRQRVLEDQCVGWRDVVEEWDVPRDVAERALGLAVQRSARAHPSGRMTT